MSGKKTKEIERERTGLVTEAGNRVMLWGMLLEILVRQTPCESIKRSEFRAVSWESLANME